MKKLFTLMMLCLSVSATAWAQITEEWTNAAPPHSRPIITTLPENMSYDGGNKVHAVTQVIKVETQGTVSVTLSITEGTLNLLGIDLAKANGKVQAYDYTARELTTSNYTATLSNVPAGYYVLRYFVHNNTANDGDLTNTTGSLTVTGAVQAPVISDLANLSNDKVYLVKSGRTTASKDVYLLYNSKVGGYLSSNYDEESKNTSLYDGLDNFQFAIYKHTDNKYYFYIPKGYKIVGNATGNTAAIPLGFVADTDMEIRTTSTVTNYPFMLSTNRSGALNVADTDGKHGVVNWSDGYNQKGDRGNAFQFIEAGSLSADIQAEVANRITKAEDYNTAFALSDAITRLNPDGQIDKYVGNYSFSDAYNLTLAVVGFQYASSNTNYNTMMTEYNNVINNASKVTLNNGEIFQIKCTTAERGYLAFYNTTVNNESGQTTFDGNTTLTLAGVTATSGFPNVGAENVSTDWAMYKYNDKCYLYNTENKKFIKASNNASLSFTEDAAQASPVTLESIDGKVAGWRLKFVGTSYYMSFSHGFGLNGGARTYTDANDAGVQHYLIKTGSSVSDTDQSAIAYNIVSTDITNFTTYINACKSRLDNSGTLGYYSYSSANGYDPATVVSEAAALSASSTVSEIETTMAKLQEVRASFSYNQPKPGKLYRFKGKTSERYMKSNGAGNKMTVSANTTTDNGPATIFMVTDDNRLLSYDLGLYANDTHSIGSTASNSNQYSFLESEGGHVGYYTIKSNYSGSKYLYSNTSTTDRNSTYAAGNCDWTIEEVTWLPVRIYDDTYKLGTFYSPLPLSRKYSAERVKVYTGAVTNNFFNLTELTSDVLPANTAFVIEYRTGKASSDQLTGTRENEEYVFLPVASAPTLTEAQEAQLASNQLQGQFETITTPTIADKTICTMQEINSALTFARYTGTTVKGFRAYLPVATSTTEGGATSFRLVFGGIPTGIDAIGTQPAEGQTIYDLSGRRVERATKGLYIVNGKKVMIK